MKNMCKKCDYDVGVVCFHAPCCDFLVISEENSEFFTAIRDTNP